MSLPVKEQRELIDKAVGKHLAAILVLKTQRNCLAPISQLPPEILCRIFAFAKLSYGHIHSPYSNTALAWIKITHVSTHWRYAAMNSPTLWADPPPQRGRWVTEMLERSKSADLTIDTRFNVSEPSKIAGVKKILQHGTRIRHLTLTNMALECKGVLENLPVSAPRLETLCLTATWPKHKGWDDVCIPETFLRDSWKLRHLILSGFNFHWNCFPLANITHLELHDIAKPARPTWTQFMDALANLSKLQSLDLKSILDPTVKLTTDTSSSLVHLSLLQSLILESPTSEVEMFFGHVTFPPSAKVYVRGVPSSRSICEMSAAISSIARLYSDQEFLTLALREAGPYDSDFVQLKLFQQVVERSTDRCVNTALLTLELLIRQGQPTADQIIPVFFNNGLPLDKVSHVGLATKTTDPNTLMYTLGNLPSLSIIRVKSQSGISFVKALYPNPEYFPLYFKRLTTIVLSVIFKSTRGYTERNPYEIDLQLLQNCLIQRYECGSEIQKLGLDDCYRITGSDVEELENIVVDVEWDSKMQHIVHSESEEDSNDSDEEDIYWDNDEDEDEESESDDEDDEDSRFW